MIIKDNTTAIDVAFNLSGSLTGFTDVLNQLPVGKKVGFDNMPKVFEDTNDIGQTWTPYIVSLDLVFNIPVFSTRGTSKAPYTTNLLLLETAIDYGNAQLKQLLND